MRFDEFARMHGLIIRNLRTSNYVNRVPTTDHPNKKNGAYYFDGIKGWVQNWATGEEPIWWINTGNYIAPIQTKSKETNRKETLNRNAALLAADMLKTAVPAQHPYLQAKGLNDYVAILQDSALFIPMRHAKTNELTGAQTIKLVNNEWEKKFLRGSKLKESVHRLGHSYANLSVLCEGYATALSIHKALAIMGLKSCVVVCFCASNLPVVARLIEGKKIVFADNDMNKTGEKAAKECGVNYCMSSAVGEDANDLHCREGINSLCKLIMGAMR